jgi:hypothetical protein
MNGGDGMRTSSRESLFTSAELLMIEGGNSSSLDICEQYHSPLKDNETHKEAS